ncbi:MAG TPA: hypothetical protein VF765_19065 [Polyangiaceae bacterium]
MLIHRGIGRLSLMVAVGGSSLLVTSESGATCTTNVSLSPPNNTEMNPWGLVGTPYNVGAGWSLTASGGTAGGYDWTGPSQQSPTNGMYLQTGGPGTATNLLIGTPTMAGGPFDIAVGVADYPGGCTGVSATYPLFVCSSTMAVLPASGPLAAGVVGTGYSASIDGSGGSHGYAWSMTGSLPPGLSFAGNGISGAAANLLIQGTPTTPGTYSFQLGVADWPNYNPSDSTAITKCAVVTNDYSIIVTDTGTDAGVDGGDDASADGSVPDASMPDGSMPDATMPDGSMPDASMPDATSEAAPDTGGSDVGGNDAGDAACLGLDQSCQSQSDNCCSGYKCEGTNLGASCCAEEGTSCSQDTDCCTGGFACRGGHCSKCGTTGGSCSTAADCCTGFDCLNEVCVVGEGGACASDGAGCNSDAECCSDQCIDGTCSGGCRAEGEACLIAGDCCSGFTCGQDGVCESPSKAASCVCDLATTGRPDDTPLLIGFGVVGLAMAGRWRRKRSR